ncbi:multidrug transporter [Skermanella stibiiresistens SB22]|uniref:Bcr/CflA family efflux transporter n=1 Tax=Skermanella stibiiresistens SB22 TaxID=1385369 RepID=W9HBQ4_9PROT|nr:multidrug effflux MFS transporter [Skermanella stibiiresistens]EWY41323.1 multidrug transporter [Skermanella stibiiresistens SB22]
MSFAAVRPPHIAILIAITAIGPMALNIFIPSIPGLVRVFETDYGTAQLALTLYLVGIGCGQLIYGPLSDRFGRRPVLLAGLGIFVAASLVCALAPSIGTLIAGRIVQAVGGCAGMVLSRAIVRDVHERDKAASTLAYITMAMAVAPAIAPALGGFLEVWFGWRASFLMVLACGAAVWLWSLGSLRETNFQRQPLPGIIGMVKGYGALLRNRAYLGFALNTAFVSAVFFAFLAGAPYIMIELLKRPPSEYGALFVLVSAGYALGSFIAARLATRLGARRLVLVGTVTNIAGVAVMGVLGLLGHFHALGIFLPMCLAAVGSGIAMPSGIAAAISVNPRVAGAASGLLGFLQMSVGAVATVAVGYLKDDDQMPMILVMVVAGALSVGAYLMAIGARRPSPDAVPAPGTTD